MKRQRTLSDHHQRKHQKDRGFSAALTSSLEWHFNKVFTYTIPEKDCRSFHSDDLFSEEAWQDEALLAVKVKLNAVKSELSDKDIGVWHKHTSIMNPGGFIVSRVREQAKPEFCTQAWCKFHEILAAFPLVETCNDGTFRTLHLCEAPGAFIASLNHYIKSRDIWCNWKWSANTLNPHYEGNGTHEMIADDKFVLQTQARWYFGPDNSGDIMSPENMRSLQDTYKMAKCHLVTADGSIDCADNPAEQESLTSRLHYCELVTALSVLTVGGHLVLKMFTLLENTAVGMMYLMCCVFEKVTVFKPASSKPGNSEVYIVSRSFRGMSDSLLETLLLNTAPSTKSIFRKTDIPQSFRSQHLACCELFANYQIKTIRKNQATFTNEVKDTSHSDGLKEDTLEMEKECCAHMYIEKCQIKAIPWVEKLIVSKAKSQKECSFGVPLSRRKVEGSFVERQEFVHLSWQERISRMKLFDVEPVTAPFTLKRSNKDTACYEDVSDWAVVTGKKVDTVRSSRFCTDKLLSLYRMFLQHEQPQSQPGISIVDPVIQHLYCYSCKHQFDAPSMLLVGDICPLLTELMHCLERKGVNVILNSTNHSVDCSSIHVVSCPHDLMEARLLVDQRVFGRCLQVILQEMQRGDCLLLHTSILLTRLYVGLIYTLNLLFETVEIIATQNTAFPSIYIMCENFLFHTTNSGMLPGTSDMSPEVSSLEEFHSTSSRSDQDLSGVGVSRLPGDGACVMKDHKLLMDTARGGHKASDLTGYLMDVYRQWLASQQDNGTQLLEFVPMRRLYESEVFENMLWLNDNLLMERMNHFITQYSENSL